MLYPQGLVDYLGHCTARVYLGCNQLSDGEPPPAETRIHTEIQARSDVGEVVHTHQTASTLLGLIGSAS